MGKEDDIAQKQESSQLMAILSAAPNTIASKIFLQLSMRDWARLAQVSKKLYELLQKTRCSNDYNITIADMLKAYTTYSKNMSKDYELIFQTIVSYYDVNTQIWREYYYYGTDKIKHATVDIVLPSRDGGILHRARLLIALHLILCSKTSLDESDIAPYMMHPYIEWHEEGKKDIVSHYYLSEHA